jgi:hypothetical protein
MKERSSAEVFLSSGTVPRHAARRSGQLDHRFPAASPDTN